MLKAAIPYSLESIENINYILEDTDIIQNSSVT